MSYFGDKRITVFTGHYGSGKTEISINYVLMSKNNYQETALVDLDFVNPYFRSREARDFLQGDGIRVIASAEDCFNTDLPAFSPQIGGVLQNRKVRVIVDLGGDEIGARAAGRFRHQIADGDYEMYFVVNPFRPFTTTPAEVSKIIADIETSSRLKVSALVSNPNLHNETKEEDILAGHQEVQKMARFLGVPVRFLAVEQSFADRPGLQQMALPILWISRRMLAPWE